MTSIVLLLLTLIQGFTIRGTVWEGEDKPAVDATVILTGENGLMNTRSAKDGSFQFIVKGAGYFELNAVLGPLFGHPSAIFVNQNMDGIGIMLRASVNPFVLGKVKVEGGQALPSPLPKIVIKYPSGTIASRVDLTTQGLFFCAVAPTEFNIGLENLNEPYFVKSIMKGTQDAMKNPVKLTEGAATNLEITLGVRK